MINPWKVLGVHRKSTDDEIREAYLSLARICHPDALGTGARDEAIFQNVNAAYHAIRNKKMRTALLNSIVGAADCSACRGQGCTSKSKSMTAKQYTACEMCGGAGIIIHKEKADVTIKLRGTTGTSRKGRDKKR